ncbi:HAD-IA family hydrolase [Arcicella aquatica]|uniref:HAD-IA family hydrolase n=1 Tax=Arcicella aquatica TaxID=217141 RepID=A0ABU5QRA2_9BACT|nr:HAD-IA family hydrolase [Arcicella aquatica]MEA5259613.1 HAD-IA family hydrolase [Arcicella aquatica]
MKVYKHYSFDLWLTLIKSNPTFKKERAFFFFKHLNASKKTLIEVEIIFRRIDLMVNAVNQKSGRNISAEEMYLMVVYEINESDCIFHNLDITWLLNEMELLFFQYIPVIYDENTLNALKTIKENNEISMSILSNTGFIKGSTLRVVLERLELAHLFDFQLYSDEEGLSKPNPKFFELMLNKVSTLKENRPISSSEIIHVGDNLVADIYGANFIEINSFQINSNKNTISDLLK